MRARLIYEKFVQDSDPIKDLGIGIKAIAGREIGKMFGMTFLQVSEYMYGENWIYISESIFIFEFFRKIYYNDISLQNAYNEIIKRDKIYRDKSFQDNVIHKLKERYGIEVNYFMLRESLNEKFVEDSDPIKDLRIGYTPVNFSKKRIEFGVYPKSNRIGLNKWLEYLRSLRGKTIRGIFESEKDIISFRIRNYTSINWARKLVFYSDEIGAIHRINFKRTYYIK
jgi:hypothetical protein